MSSQPAQESRRTQASCPSLPVVTWVSSTSRLNILTLFMSPASSSREARCSSASERHSAAAESSPPSGAHSPPGQIGRESCREREWQYVELPVVAESLTKKTDKTHKKPEQH